MKLFYIAGIILLTLSGCGTDNEVHQSANKLSFRLSTDSSAVELHDLPPYLIKEVELEPGIDTLWHNFFAVYQESSDPEMRDFQPAIVGDYNLVKDVLIFTPDTSFKAGSYFARCYIPELLQQAEDMISSRDIRSSEGYTEYKFQIR